MEGRWERTAEEKREMDGKEELATEVGVAA
jgi:hypothetical protein